MKNKSCYIMGGRMNLPIPLSKYKLPRNYLEVLNTAPSIEPMFKNGGNIKKKKKRKKPTQVTVPQAGHDDFPFGNAPEMFPYGGYMNPGGDNDPYDQGFVGPPMQDGTYSTQGNQSNTNTQFNNYGNWAAAGTVFASEAGRNGQFIQTPQGGPSTTQKAVGSFGPWGAAISAGSSLGTNATVGPDKSNTSNSLGTGIFNPSRNLNVWGDKNFNFGEKLHAQGNPFYYGFEKSKRDKRNAAKAQETFYRDNAVNGVYQDGGKVKQAWNPNLASKDKKFQDWYSKNTLEGQGKIPFSDNLDYDYFSFYKNKEQGNIQDHFPDTYKRPSHPTFSNESIYSTPENPGGRWEGENYIKADGGSISRLPGGVSIDEGQGIESIEGAQHEQGGVEFSQEAEVQGGEKVLDQEYVLTDESMTDGKLSIAKRFDKNVKSPLSINSVDKKEQFTEYQKSKSIMKNERYLATKRLAFNKDYAKLLKKHGGNIFTQQYPDPPAPNGLLTPDFAQGGWIKGAVNPAHKGYCTPMTKSTCTPHRKAFAMRAKAHFKEDGGVIKKPLLPGYKYPYGGPLDEDRSAAYNLSQLRDEGFSNYGDYLYGESVYGEPGRNTSPINNFQGSGNIQVPNMATPPINSSNAGYGQTGPPMQNGRFSTQGNPGTTSRRFDWGRAGNQAATYAPIAYNLGMGLFSKVDKLKERDYQVPDQNYWDNISDDATLRKNRTNYREALYNMKNSGNYRLSGQVGLFNAKNEADDASIERVNNVNKEGRYRSRSENIGNKFRNKQIGLTVNDINAQRTGRKQNFLSTGLGQLSQAAQGSNRDKQSVEILNQMFDDPDFLRFLEEKGYKKKN